MAKRPLPGYKDNLPLFLSQLRDYLLLSQDDVADHFCFDRSRVSRYENSRTKDQPKLGYLAGLACLAADQANNDHSVQNHLLKAINEAIRHHYSQRRFATWDDLRQEANSYLSKQRAKVKSNTTQTWQQELENRLDLPSPIHLVGVEANLRCLEESLLSESDPWIICIDGMGGIGKTSIANALVRQPALAGRFEGVAWISARKQNYIVGQGVQPVPEPVLSSEALLDNLLMQCNLPLPHAASVSEKKAALVEFLKETPYLITVDNLETLEDYQAILPTLHHLTNPSKIVLTSRFSLRTRSGIFTVTLDELSRPDAMQLIRDEAQVRNLPAIGSSPDSTLHDIYTVVGGNPLALKLIVGQIAVLALDHVLENLKQAQGKDIQELYNFLYWQAWHLLSPTSQQVFLVMPLTEHGTLDQLAAIAQLEPFQVGQALQQLAELSLVQIRGDDLNKRRYSIHALTETFLLNEALAWSTLD
ncbi:MAG: hypothetical protein KDJ52_20995 [Anaerolineae bacterium]|nr:hypothetical protein [Anaerolineae bacterium]